MPMNEIVNEVVSADQLKQYMSRIEKLETEKSDLMDDIKQVYDEAKANGFDTKIMKQLVRLRKMDKNQLDEQDALLELYRAALDI